MTAKAGYFTPMLHVQEIERSIRFYELLGFETVDTDRCTPLGWARMHCEGGALMFLRAEEPMPEIVHSVVFAMYTPDLPALRDQLAAAGMRLPPITRPEYMPSGQMTLKDPDGYMVGINHWSDKEHQDWLKRIGRAASSSD